MYKVSCTQGSPRQRTPSTFPHQNAISDVHNQAMVAVRGKAYNAVAINAAERANRCAEVRLRNTKKHIDFMQHLDLVRLKRERVEMLDRLEKFRRSLIKIQTSKSDLLRLEKQANVGKVPDSSRTVTIPAPKFSQHSPRLRQSLPRRYPNPAQTKLTPMFGRAYPKTDACHSTPAIQCNDYVLTQQEKEKEFRRVKEGFHPRGNFGRRLSVIPQCDTLDSLRRNPALQVVSVRKSREPPTA